jgi:hypothetical protein
MKTGALPCRSPRLAPIAALVLPLCLRPSRQAGWRRIFRRQAACQPGFAWPDRYSGERHKDCAGLAVDSRSNVNPVGECNHRKEQR